MPRAAEPLSLAEHREMADELQRSHARLRELSKIVSEIYGGESRAAFAFERAAEAVDRLRREMHLQSALDWPEAAEERLYL